MFEVDVAVVGLGISGLTALRALSASGIHSVGIDARPRFGGRTTRVTTDGGFSFEAGGEFLKPSHTRVRELMAELGVAALPVASRGDGVTIQDGVRVVGGTPFADRPAAAAQYAAARAEFAALAATIVVGAVFSSPDAQSLDSVSVSEWVASVVADDAVRARLSRELVSGLGGPGADLSLLVALGYAAAAIPQGIAHDEQRVAGGGFALAEALARAIPNDRLVLDSPVTRIERVDGAVLVTGPHLEVRARAVIVAMSPKLVRAIEFEPALPEAQRRLFDGWTQAFGTKNFIVYDTPWWRAAGLSGFASGDLTVRSLGDLSPEDGSVGILVAETHPVPGDEVAPDPEAQRALVLAAVERYLGTAPSAPLDFGYHFWPADPLAGGCGSPLPPGLMTEFGASLAKPVGRIHFAGTETSDWGWGSMEGAVRAGERAAAEVTP